MDAISSPAGTAAMSTGMQLKAAMLSKEKEIMEQQGQAMVQLVQSTQASAPQGNLGNNIDVTA